MYLKALTIQGFKSFADKTCLRFEKDITAIVGPNGSGKSNIADAILWVMGEQRAKTLRGGKMEDVIFGGTAIRNPLGFAEVSLLLDNSAGIFDSGTTELELTRRYYRSGESEYYINREQVRLKDIHSLLMDTGLGRDGYSIIGQGKIADIVSTKSTDRREVFDEAAGISRFRYRKEEAEHRLEKTEENLLRISDKIDELELQVGPLKDQSEKAKKYLLLRDDLRIREVSAWMTALDHLREKADAVQKEYEEAQLLQEKAKAELEALYSSNEGITERMHRQEEESEKARERLAAKETEISSCDSRIAVLNENVKNNEESLRRLLEDLTSQKGREAEIRENMAQNEERMNSLKKDLQGLAEEITSNNNVLEGCRMKISGRESSVNQLTDRANKLSVDLQTMDSRIHMLSEMEKDFEGYSKAVKAVMKESARGTLRGIRGPVANLIKSDNECALAIETALGAAAQNIVVDTKKDGQSAIEMLKRTDSGRGTFLPLDTIRGSILNDAPENEPGFVGIAYDLVSFRPEYDGIIANLLGRTVIVETLTDAVRISQKYNDRFRMVTLDGQMMNAGGSMTGGSTAKGTGILSRANELAGLQKRRKDLAEKQKSSIVDLERAKTDLASIRYQLELAMEDRTSLTSRQSSLNAEIGSLTATQSQFQILLDSLGNDSETRRLSMEKTEKDNAVLREKISEQEKIHENFSKQADEIRKEIERITQTKFELEGKRSRVDKELQDRNQAILELNNRVSRIEQRKYAAETEEKQLTDKLWDSYELSYSAAQQLRRPVENLQKENREINELRRQISALGTPNIGAIEEYERVNTRYEFLDSQRNDVKKAKDELLAIINDVTEEMKTLFLEQFDKINEAFVKTFTELFGGGKAALQLEDPENVLECGIEIKVQPPGKTLSSLTLLSGGEMAFVAIALYFAILKVRPTPFCVMDEIEAALDEANVFRYAEYMRRMSDKTQFLVITHRRGTMEAADMLYGVTMQEKGVSTILELDLAEATKSASDR